MTAPALILLADSARADADTVALQRLKRQLARLRSGWTCHVAQTGPAGDPGSLSAVLRRVRLQGLSEAVCVPLDTGHVTSAPTTAVRSLELATSSGVHCTLAAAIGAPGALFTAVDRQLRAALARHQSRELDSLVLLHDGSTDDADLALLARRARSWGAHHRLPVTCAGIDGRGHAGAALAAHALNGRRHTAVGWLSVLDAPELRRALSSDPRVTAVAAPLDADAAVLDAVVASYSVAALRSLALNADVA